MSSGWQRKGGATIAIIDAGGMAFVHNDHLATPQVMTDGAAAVVWDASYRPFGEASIAGAAINEQRFPGQTADAETGYHDNWYRTYDPSLGRYLQSDPIGLAAGFNSYAYANGNPVMLTDPTGELAFVPVFIVLAEGAGLGLTLYEIGDFGLRWYDNYRAGGCTNLWGARPEISPWDVAFLLAGPAAKAGKWAALGARGWGRGFANLEGGDVPFDLAKLAKIEAALERQGVRVWRDADSTRFLAQRNSGGQFIDDLDLGPLVILPKSPSRTAVVEELLHLGQWRKAGRRIDDARIPHLEIEAQHRLLALGQRKGWTENEISQLRKALEFWQNKAMQ